MSIFYDTSPFIYLVEDHPKYGNITSENIIDNYENYKEMVTSVITISEFGVKPAREKNEVLIKSFRNVLSKLDFKILSVKEKEAIMSYQLRAKYAFLKSMDALQLSLAILDQCEVFITNDKKLSKIDEIRIITIEELLKTDK